MTFRKRVSQFFDYIINRPRLIKKFFIAVATALTTLMAALADGTVTTVEGIAIALAFLGALGVYAVPNK